MGKAKNILLGAVILMPLLAQAGPKDKYRLEIFYRQVDPWIYQHTDPRNQKNFNPKNLTGHYSFQAGGREDLYGSIDVVYLIFSLGELKDRTTPGSRAEWAKAIQQYQDPETGWFSRGNEAFHFKSHATAYAVSALKLLGAKPLYPLTSAQKLTGSKEATEKWLSSILWDYVWVGSHQGGGIASALQITGEADENFFENYFSWLEQRVNPATGLWQLGIRNKFSTKPIKMEMGGAPHFWWIYWHAGRDLPYPEKIIDTCLSLQLANGLWDDQQKKGIYRPYCINLDAIWSINRARRQLLKNGKSYREDEIYLAFERALDQSVKSLNQPDSLFILYPKTHQLPGAVAGMAELDLYFQEKEGQTRLLTNSRLKPVLDYVSWL